MDKPVLFISHIAEEAALAEILKRHIQNDFLGLIRVFVSSDNTTIPVGDQWFRDVEGGLKDAKAELVLCSENSVKRPWINFEAGAAWANNIPIVPICHSGMRPDGLPIPFRLLKGIEAKDAQGLKELYGLIAKQLGSTVPGGRFSDIAEEAQAFEDEYRTRSDYRPSLLTGMSDVERFASRKLYYYPDGWVSAVKLWGDDTDFCVSDRITINYTNEPLDTPPELVATRDKIIEQAERAAELRGQIFFNGPNTRLIDWSLTASETSGIARERSEIKLQLGPVGWYDFHYLNEAFRQQRSESGNQQLYEYFMGLTTLVRDGSVRGSKLSNILDNAVTVVSNDGYVGYQRRSNRVSAAPGGLTSAIAENTNRYLDDTDPHDVTRQFHRDLDAAEAGQLPGNDYIPQGVPHPFAAVKRGIRYEVSPELAGAVEDRQIKLVGIDFDLEAMHPDLLWAVFVDLPHTEIARMHQTRQGKESIEGTLRFAPADFDSETTARLLSDKSWIPAGKASVVRTIQLIEAVCSEEYWDFGAAFDYLMRSD